MWRNKKLNTRRGNHFSLISTISKKPNFITFFTYGVWIIMKHSVSNYSLCTGIECISHIGLEMGYMHPPKIKVARFQKVWLTFRQKNCTSFHCQVLENLSSLFFYLKQCFNNIFAPLYVRYLVLDSTTLSWKEPNLFLQTVLFHRNTNV